MDIFLTVFKKCVGCETLHVIDLTECDFNGLLAYNEGKIKTIYAALPDVDPDERSLFSSCLCKNCINRLLIDCNREVSMNI